MFDILETIKKPIDFSAILFQHNPLLQRYPAWFCRFLVWGLETLVDGDRINRFLKDNDYLKDNDFIDKIFDDLKVRYLVHGDGIKNIPVKGRIIIVANHPLGGLDGLALLHLIGSLRRDVFIVVNELLMNINSLKGIFLPVDAFGSGTRKADLHRIIDALNDEKAVIIFPSGEVSRVTLKGIIDRKWLSGFLRIAKKTSAPILPIHIRARNSVLFYMLSRISLTLSMLMLPREMMGFKRQIKLTIGRPIAIRDLEKLTIGWCKKTEMINRHLRRIGRGKSPIFASPTSIINPVDRQAIRDELKTVEMLGTTADKRHILLLCYESNTAVMDEIGRLREMTFRSVGEGTGFCKDIDRYDFYYRHLILWDEEKQEIVGAYRLGEIWQWQNQDINALYTSSLFNYRPAMQPYFKQGLELGRSFVQRKFWGRRSLDYLWQGLGAYLVANPSVRYLFGPVSLSRDVPKTALDMIIYFYTTHFPDPDCLAVGAIPYVIDPATLSDLKKKMPGQDLDTDQDWLCEQLGLVGLRIPTLFKQYADVCMAGGVRFCGFSVDPAFNHCVDGLVIVDLNYLKPKKRARYLCPHSLKSQ